MNTDGHRIRWMKSFPLAWLIQVDGKRAFGFFCSANKTPSCVNKLGWHLHGYEQNSVPLCIKHIEGNGCHMRSSHGSEMEPGEYPLGTVRGLLQTTKEGIVAVRMTPFLKSDRKGIMTKMNWNGWKSEDPFVHPLWKITQRLIKATFKKKKCFGQIFWCINSRFGNSLICERGIFHYSLIVYRCMLAVQPCPFVDIWYVVFGRGGWGKFPRTDKWFIY